MKWDLSDIVLLAAKCVLTIILCNAIMAGIYFGIPWVMQQMINVIYAPSPNNEEILGKEVIDDDTVVIYVRDNAVEKQTSVEPIEKDPRLVEHIEPYLRYLVIAGGFVVSIGLSYVLLCKPKIKEASKSGD